MFFKVDITLGKTLDKYSMKHSPNGDLNIDELKTGSDLSNHSLMLRMSLTLQTCLRNPLVLNRIMELLLT